MAIDADGERDDEPEPVVAVAAAPEHPERVDRRDEEPADEVRGDEHVQRLQRHRLVEDDLERVDVDDLAGRVQREPLRLRSSTRSPRPPTTLPPIPAMTIGTPVQKWGHGFSRLQP